MNTRIRPIFFLALWLLSVGQTPAPETTRPSLATLDLLLENDDRAAIPLLQEHIAFDARQRDLPALRQHTISLVKILKPRAEEAEAMAALAFCLSKFAENGQADSRAAGELWMRKALSHRRLEQFSDAFDTYRRAIRIFEKHGELGENPTFCYKNAAQILIRRHDFAPANELLEAALRTDTSGDYAQSLHQLLSTNFFWQDSLDRAWLHFQKGLDAPVSDALSRADLDAIGGTILLKKGDWAAAGKLFRGAFPVFEKSERFDSALRCCTALAEIAQKSGQFAEAEKQFARAENIGLKNFKEKNREMAKLYVEWGDFRRTQKNKRGEVLGLYQKALVQAFPGFESSDPSQNPSPVRPPTELWAMTAAARKAQAILELAEDAGRGAKPELQRQKTVAADCFDLAFSVAEQLRKTYGRDESKIYLQKNNYDFRREAAVNLWELMAFENSGTETAFRLFDLLENNRAATLRDALQQQNALENAGLPDSLRRREESLRRDLAQLQKDLSDAQTSGDSAKSSRLKTAVFTVGRQYDDLLLDLASGFPTFKQYAAAGDFVPAERLCPTLPDSVSLLSWFDAGDRFLCLTLRRKGCSGFEVSKDSAFDLALEQLLRILPDREAQVNSPGNFFKLARQIGEKLLPESLLRGAKHLLVIPDGRLCYLPFEVLLTAPYPAGRYASAPYLVRSHNVSYAWSASLLSATNSNEETSGKGFFFAAPFAKSGRGGLPALPHSPSEMPENAADAAKNGLSATDFLQNAGQFAAIHLATHAGSGVAGHPPGVEFSDRAAVLPEIYACRLRANLVVLSACESGLGVEARGEGLLSLARAFAYAGAKNLVASLWQVNDLSTASLFSDFHKNLKSGETFSESLRHSKLRYLSSSSSDVLKIPWFWAAFTLTGHDGHLKIEKNQPSGIAWAVAVAGSILATFWFFYRKK